MWSRLVIDMRLRSLGVPWLVRRFRTLSVSIWRLVSWVSLPLWVNIWHHAWILKSQNAKFYAKIDEPKFSQFLWSVSDFSSKFQQLSELLQHWRYHLSLDWMEFLLVDDKAWKDVLHCWSVHCLLKCFDDCNPMASLSSFVLRTVSC